MSRRTYRLLYLLMEKTVSSPMSLQSRMSYSTTGATDALDFAKNRKHFEVGMSALRKQWAEKHRAIAAQKAAEALQRIENQRAIRVNRLAEGAEARERRAKLLEQQRAKAEDERNKVKELRLRRQQLRTDILEAAKDVRKQKLMVASCDWVDPDTLDRRIEEALDTPEPLNRIIVGATK